MRGPGLLSFVAVVVVASLTSAARVEAQAPPGLIAAGAATENTRAACSDGLDNDGDGHVDCADQDCQDFTFCAAAIGTHGDRLAHLRGRGTSFVVVGAVLLTLGVGIAAASAPLWLAGSGGNDAMYAIGGGMVGGGALLIGGGTALLAIGAGNLAETRRPRFALEANGATIRF